MFCSVLWNFEVGTIHWIVLKPYRCNLLTIFRAVPNKISLFLNPTSEWLRTVLTGFSVSFLHWSGRRKIERTRFDGKRCCLCHQVTFNAAGENFLYSGSIIRLFLFQKPWDAVFGWPQIFRIERVIIDRIRILLITILILGFLVYYP